MSAILAKSFDMAPGPITYWKARWRTVSTLFCGGYRAVWNASALVTGRAGDGDSELQFAGAAVSDWTHEFWFHMFIFSRPPPSLPTPVSV